MCVFGGWVFMYERENMSMSGCALTGQAQLALIRQCVSSRVGSWLWLYSAVSQEVGDSIRLDR